MVIQRVCGPRRFIGGILLLIALSALQFSAAEQPQRHVTDAEFDQALIAALDAISVGDREELERLLRPVASRFQPVEIGTVHGQANWQELTLNQRGHGLDGIRFRTPADEARDLRWAFVMLVDGNIGWSIFPVEGRSEPFRRFRPYAAARVQGLPPVDLPADATLIFQSHEAELMRPDREYIIWFRTPPDESVTLHLAINLLSEGVHDPDTLGLEIIEQ